MNRPLDDVKCRGCALKVHVGVVPLPGEDLPLTFDTIRMRMERELKLYFYCVYPFARLARRVLLSRVRGAR